MPTVAELSVVVAADTRDFDAGIRHVEQQTRGLGSTISSGLGMGLGFGAIEAGIGLLGSAFSAAKGSVIDLNGSLEQSSIAFTTMLGSGEASAAFLGDLQKFAAATPFEFPDLVSASKRMLAFGFESKAVVPLLTAVGDAVAAVGGGAETIDGVTVALGQMQAKGKVSAEEMGQLAERGIPAWDMLAKQMGVSVAEAMDAVSKGQVKAGVFIEAFQKGSAERFGGMMEKQALTWSGALSTITDSLTMATAKAFQPFFKLISEGAITVAAFLQSDAFAAWATAAADAITDVVGGVRTLMAALRPVISFLTGPWDDATAAAQARLVEAFGPEVAAMVADMARLAGEALGELAAFIRRTFGTLFDWWGENWPLISAVLQQVLLGMALLWQQHGAAIETIVRALWTIISTTVEVALKQVLNLMTLAMQVITGDWEGAWGTVGVILRTAWDGNIKILRAAWDIIFALLDDATGGALRRVAEWLQATDAAVVKAGADLRGAVDRTWNGATGILNVLTTAWGDATAATDAALNDGGRGIVALARTGWDAVSTATTDAFNAAGAGVVAVVGAGWGAASTATTDAFNAGAGIVAVVGAGWDAASTATTDAFNAGGAGIVAVVGAGWGAASTATTDAFNAGAGIVALVGTGWDAASTATTDAFNAGAGIVAVVAAGWDVVSTATTDAFNAAGAGIVAVVGAGWGLVVAATDAAFAAGAGIVALVGAGWDAVSRATTDAFNAAGAGIVAVVGAGWDAVVAATSAILGDSQRGLEAAVAAPWEAVVAWLRGLARGGGDLASAAADIGTSIVDGLQQGIEGALDGLKSFVTNNLTNALPEWVRSVLKISSPSRVFADIGAQIVDGLIAGLDRGSGELLKKATEMATKLVGTFDDVGDMGGVENVLRAALAYTGHPESWMSGLKWIVHHESGGDPTAKNPESTATGLFQLIDTTWAAYRDKKLENDVRNPFANAVAGINYIDSRYDDPAGAIAFWKQNNWYGDGGIAWSPQVAVVGEKGPEAIIPLSRLGALGGDTSIRIVIQGSLVAQRDLEVVVADAWRRAARGGRL